MGAASDAASFRLELHRTLPVSPERIYRAWTDPELLTRWFAPSDELTPVIHAADVRIGGTYRIEMRHRNGASYTVRGQYHDVSPNRRLVFTWRWEHDTEMPETLVTVESISEADGTELVLRHEQFASEDQRAEHEKGWNGCLGRLMHAL